MGAILIQTSTDKQPSGGAPEVGVHTGVPGHASLLPSGLPLLSSLVPITSHWSRSQSLVRREQREVRAS